MAGTSGVSVGVSGGGKGTRLNVIRHLRRLGRGRERDDEVDGNASGGTNPIAEGIYKPRGLGSARGPANVSPLPSNIIVP